MNTSEANSPTNGLLTSLGLFIPSSNHIFLILMKLIIDKDLCRQQGTTYL